MTSLPTDPSDNLARLIRCASVTPADAGALSVLEGLLAPMGFAGERPAFAQAGTADIENLYARRGGEGPHLMFAGHTDVVPPGDVDAWSHDPFGAKIADGRLFGRGAVDMKGGIACFVAALARLVEKGEAPSGSVSLLITGDEEGPAINGTVKLLDWAAARGETWDGCLLGEPTNPDAIGDMIKIGRRGSLSGTVTVTGTQGHVAYPHLADNPLRGVLALGAALVAPALDEGTQDFQPSNLEITTIDTGNRAANVIPARATMGFNIRFNDRWTEPSLKAAIADRLSKAATDATVRHALDWAAPVSPVFLTRNDALTGALAASIASVTGRQPVLSTSGGTSDARFIKNYCPVVEFGLVGKTMHMVDEHVPLAHLEMLTAIYADFIARWFAQQGAR